MPSGSFHEGFGDGEGKRGCEKFANKMKNLEQEQKMEI
jgi:hypothetical protein